MIFGSAHKTDGSQHVAEGCIRPGARHKRTLHALEKWQRLSFAGNYSEKIRQQNLSKLQLPGQVSDAPVCISSCRRGPHQGSKYRWGVILISVRGESLFGIRTHKCTLKRGPSLSETASAA